MTTYVHDVQAISFYTSLALSLSLYIYICLTSMYVLVVLCWYAKLEWKWGGWEHWSCKKKNYVLSVLVVFVLLHLLWDPISDKPAQQYIVQSQMYGVKCLCVYLFIPDCPSVNFPMENLGCFSQGKPPATVALHPALINSNRCWCFCRSLPECFLFLLITTVVYVCAEVCQNAFFWLIPTVVGVFWSAEVCQNTFFFVNSNCCWCFCRSLPMQYAFFFC